MMERNNYDNAAAAVHGLHIISGIGEQGTSQSHSIFEFCLLDILQGRSRGNRKMNNDRASKRMEDPSSCLHLHAQEKARSEANNGSTHDDDGDDDTTTTSATSSSSAAASSTDASSMDEEENVVSELQCGRSGTSEEASLLDKETSSRVTSNERMSMAPRRSLFKPFWQGDSKSSAPTKNASCFKSSRAAFKRRPPSSPVFVPKASNERIVVLDDSVMSGEGAPPVLELSTPESPQYGRYPPSSSRRSIFSKGRSGDVASDDSTVSTVSLSYSSSVGSLSGLSIASLSTMSPSPPPPSNRKCRNSAPSPSCIRSSRFSSSERSTASTPHSKEASVRFHDRIDIVHFTPPKETWSQGGWENYFSV